MEETALTVQDAKPKQLSMFDMTPEQKVKFSAGVANALYDVVEKQKLYTVIQGRKYLRVEAWATLGVMLNVLPKEEKIIEHADGSFEAWVNLVSTSTGLVVGGASALCGMDEKRWSSADKYARRSMSVTRATGKAYRLAFAFIPAMANYATTPAEEMPEVTFEQKEETYQGTPKQKRDLVVLAQEVGIDVKDTDLLKDLSKRCEGKPISALRGYFKDYQDTLDPARAANGITQ